MSNNIELLQQAHSTFQEKNIAFTKKRKNILSILLEQNTPISAYEISKKYEELHEIKIPPMSIYRILKVFCDLNLIHQLRSINKFMACHHIACCSQHDVMTLLICMSCEKVLETKAKPLLLEELGKMTLGNNCQLVTKPLELQTICRKCNV